MNVKKIVIIYSILFALMLFSIDASTAITASLGNSRMTIRAAPDEVVERSILVKNVNDVPLTINISASGDLADNIEIEETSFKLNPGEEKKAVFTIKADSTGKTESKINFGFKPEEGNGVGLSSVITFLAEEKYEGQGSNEVSDQTDSADESTKTNIDLNLSSIANSKFLIISGVILFAILIVLYFYYLTVKPNKVKNE